MKDEHTKKILYILFAKAKSYFATLSWRGRVVIVLFLCALLSFAVFGVVRAFKTDPAVSNAPPAETPDERVAAVNIPPHYIRRAIDGVYVPPEAADIYPVAVMIDNDPLARPQAGLAQAQLVYEARAESGITRFMAVFAAATTTPTVIGPVRSARPYFVDWARGLRALYAHVGGSPKALEMLRSISLFNLNEFYQGRYFWRGENNPMPHNVYTAAENLYAYLERMNAAAEGLDAWLYQDDAVDDVEAWQDITINYSVLDFLVEWRYESQQNQYVRFMGGTQHKDADGTAITAKNVVMIQVPAEVIDAELRRHMATVGQGRAWYCFDGQCREGVWKKPAKDVREKIYDSSNEEVRFSAGTTWVEVIQYEKDMTITQKTAS